MALRGTLPGMAAGLHLELTDHRNQRLTLTANGAFVLPQDPPLDFNIRSLGAPVGAGNHPSSLVIDAKDRFLYASNRDSDDISVYEISRSDRQLQQIPGSPFAACDEPTSISADFGGRYLLVTCAGDDSLRAFQLDQHTGFPSFVPGSAVSTGATPEKIAVTQDLL